MHIKTIKGKRYYYESRRVGKKVLSKYIGPVEGKRRGTALEDIEEIETQEEDSYIG